MKKSGVQRLIWCSDVHLNFLDKENRERFYKELRESEGDSILITGDIAESQNIALLLSEIKENTGKKLYFVAGNHDYYNGSIKSDRAKFKKFSFAHYLPKSWGVKLDAQTVLIGQDAWGDCRNGDYENSRLTMSDWLYIAELNKAYLKGMEPLKKTLQGLADKDAERVAKSVLKALESPLIRRIIIATHVPPFEEACLYAGKKSTPSGLPFFSSQILGKTIIPIVEDNPNIDFLWLSGHTHSRANIQKRPNLTVKVAHSEYYRPQIEEILGC
jgi:predicted phosphohydrolase